MKSDFEKLTDRLKTAMSSFLEGAKYRPDYSVIIETDFEHEKYRTKLDDRNHNMSFSNDFTDIFDTKTCEEVQAELEAAIRDAADRKMCCQVIYPPDLVSRVAQDVLRMSTAEPCGIDGCVIYIMLKEKDRSYPLATVLGNPSTPPTFEIHLTLREDDKSWRKFQKLYYTIKGCILNSQWKSIPRILCSAYQLEKRRLYRRSV
ncbi:unnamed protein product [Candidula unifasciata]|uniref:Uncharacterized protein n=1 Tax=Candidula unifasciata TaxID=100452 RepID=A0A8S3Z688_9EUPU|nr:unnamed protein product [Candidula unifasciata]